MFSKNKNKQQEQHMKNVLQLYLGSHFYQVSAWEEENIFIYFPASQ